MSNQYEKSFNDIVHSEFSTYKNQFTKKMSLHTSPMELLEEENGNVNGQLTQTHNSSPELNKVFFDLNYKVKNNKHLRHLDLCEEYCKEKSIPYSKAVKFFPPLFTLYKIRSWLSEIMSEIKANKEEIEQDIQESEKGEFTNARRFLAIELLIKAAGKEIHYGEKGINKTKIAGFIDFLVSNEANPKEMRNTSLYDRVKNNWGKPDKASIENLNYIKEQFKKIGLTNVTQEVEIILNSKNI